MSNGKPKLNKKVVSLVSNHYTNSDEENVTSEEEEIEEEEENIDKESSKDYSDNDEKEKNNDNIDEREILDAIDKQINNDNSNLNNQATSVNSSNLDSQQVDIKSETMAIDSKIFTYQNGFLPGSESIKLPPAPKVECSQMLQDKIIIVREHMIRYGYNINEDIQAKKHFKNPSIYEKLIEHHKINEFGSSFPSHIEDLKSQGYLFYDELDLIQRNDWAKKEKEKKDRTKIEVVTGTKKPKLQ